MRKFVTLFVCVVMFFAHAFAQTRRVTGRVVDDSGNPLSGVSVIVRGSTAGTTTDASGRFSLTVPSSSRAVDISAINYTTQTVSIPASNNISVTLQSSNGSLAEVVVVGYGTQRRRELTGNVATVTGTAVAEKPVQTFDQALAGRASGVQITVPSGILNSPPVFRIRGTNSLSLSSYPLVVVDGVPSFTGDFSSGYSAGNALASVNPNDIESIDIAKDAASTAIYGSRAANGVVFITTKKGKSGRTKVSYDTWLSSTQAYRLPELLNASEYLAFKTAAVANNPNFASGSSAIKYNSINDANGNPIDTRWYDYVYRKGISHNHNLNVSGGNDNTSYYFSVGYTSQQGIVKRNDFKRMNTLFNVDSRINKVLTLGGKVSFSNEQNLAATSSGSLNGAAFNTAGLGRLAIVLPPIISPYNNDGSYNLNGSAIGSSNITGISSLSYFNPVPALDLNYGNSENNHLQSNAYIQIKPINDITLRSLYGIDYLLVDNNIFQSPVAGDGYSSSGYTWSGAEKYKRWIWTNTAQFDHTFGQSHNLSLLVGNEQQRYTGSGYGISRTTLSDPAYNVVQAGFTTNNPADLFLTENYSLSTFGRLNYNYKRKYIISGNLRQDEYSALGIKKGVFWGASAGWEIAKENFWAGLGLDRVFSSFKIRGSYGKVGNVSGVGDYASYSTFASGLYGGTSTLYFSAVGNNQLKWETSKKTDVGFSFGLFKDRLTGEFAYYKNNIDGLILAVSQAPSTGLPSNPLQNIGSMYNKGAEVSLNITPILKKDFSWTSSFNVTLNKNEVTALAPGLTNISTSTSGSETVNRTMPGYSLGYLWVIRTGGVDPGTGKRVFVNSAGTPVYYQYYNAAGTYQYSTTPDGTTKYVSPVTGGNTITQAADAVMYKPTQPKGYGGWDNSVKVKNFDVDLLLTYQYGNYVYYGTNAGLHDQRWWENARDVLTDAWTAKGDEGKKYARPVYSDNVSNGSAMPLDINVFSGDFIKVKNLSIGYSFSNQLLSRAKISNLRLYVSGQNLGIITKYPGPDPEVSSNGNTTTGQGVDRNTVANARTLLVGLNIAF
jgi:TonB-dependent starch-binding outer membrane protein SusC